MKLIFDQNTKEESLFYLSQQFSLNYILNLDSLYDYLSTIKEHFEIWIEKEPSEFKGILKVFKMAESNNSYLFIDQIVYRYCQDTRGKDIQ